MSSLASSEDQKLFTSVIVMEGPPFEVLVISVTYNCHS